MDDHTVSTMFSLGLVISLTLLTVISLIVDERRRRRLSSEEDTDVQAAESRRGTPPELILNRLKEIRSDPAREASRRHRRRREGSRVLCVRHRVVGLRYFRRSQPDSRLGETSEPGA